MYWVENLNEILEFQFDRRTLLDERDGEEGGGA